MKVCSRCKLETRKSNFYRRKRSKDGLQAWCKSCSRVATRKSVKKWRDKYPEKALTANRICRLKHRDERVAQTKAWRKKYPEKKRASNKNWLASHPEQRKRISNLKCARRRARKAAAIIEPIRANFRALALEAWNHRCAYCSCDLCAPGVKIEMDHFRPIARGGSEAEYNLVPACAGCNRRKSARDPFAFLYDLSPAVVR